MTAALPLLLLLVVVVGIVVIGGFVSYNRFVSQRASIDSSWASIDVELQRRHDLIPNLVNTVKGYAAHEREVLEAVTDARANAAALEQQGASAADQAQAENVLTKSLGRLFAVAENYPDLKADQNFLALQRQLTETEDRIAASRRLFNIEVQAYNRRVESVPSNLIASIGNFERRDFFEADDPAARAPTDVQF